MTQSLAPGPTTQLVGTTLTTAESGASYPIQSGTITTAASTVTISNIGLAGNVTVYMYGTYAGVNASFEISPDNSNWFPVALTREADAISETTTGVLAANTVRAWTMGAPGLSFFRVKATAWTSGTANVAIVAGTYPFEPMVSNVARKDGNRVNVAWTVDNFVTTTAAEALLTVTESRDGAATSTFTSKTITAGKRLRITGITVTQAAAGTTPVLSRCYWRARVNTAGTVTTSSPLQFEVGTSAAAAANSVTSISVPVPDGMEFAGGSQIGFSIQSVQWVATTNTPQIALTVTGFEY